MQKLAVIPLITLISPVLASESGFYFQASAGFAGIPDGAINTANALVSYDLGLQAALEMGFLANIFSNATLRFGQEGFYIRNTLKKTPLSETSKTMAGRLSTVGGMFNAYLDMWPAQLVSFYIGGGVGLGIIEVTSSDTNASQDDSSFMYQIKAGATFKPAQNVALFTGYRYMYTTDLNDELSGFQAPRYHIGEIGLRFTFM